MSYISHNYLKTLKKKPQNQIHVWFLMIKDNIRIS
jgi:hypothetical protein